MKFPLFYPDNFPSDDGECTNPCCYQIQSIGFSYIQALSIAAMVMVPVIDVDDIFRLALPQHTIRYTSLLNES